MKRSICVFLLIAALIAPMAGCREQTAVVNPAASREDAGDTLVVGCDSGQGVFNPLYYATTYDGYVVNMVFEPLIERGESGEWTGVIADSWEISDDMLTYTVHLKTGLVFSDGQPVTAYDVENTYLALADPSYDGRYPRYAANLLGYEQYLAGAEALEGVTVTDERTVVFTFAQALRTNIELLGFPILPRHVYAFTRGDTSPLKELSETPVGSGPYVLDAYEPGQFIRLVRNELHPQAGQYDIANVVLKTTQSATELTELLAGDIDLLPCATDPGLCAAAQESGFVTRIEYPESGFSFMGYNCSGDSACGDARVRQALSYAYDADTAVNVCFEDPETGDTTAVAQLLPMSQVSWAYTDALLGRVNPYAYDPEKACELLDEAGWTVNGDSGYREKDGRTLEIRFLVLNDRPVLDLLIPLLDDWWGKALGVKFTAVTMDLNTLLDVVVFNSDANTGEWDVFYLSTGIDTDDPDALYTLFYSGCIGCYMDNLFRYSSAEADRLLDEGRTIRDVRDAAAVYEALYLVLNEDQPVQVVSAGLCSDLLNSRFTGMRTDSLRDWVDELIDLAPAG